jgi:hypothetical protein
VEKAACNLHRASHGTALETPNVLTRHVSYHAAVAPPPWFWPYFRGDAYVCPTMTLTSRAACLLVLATTFPTALNGQPRGIRLEYSLLGGATWNAPRAFASNQICPDDRALFFGARGGSRPRPWLLVEGTLDVAASYRQDTCVDGLIEPPPPQGPFTRERSFYLDQYTGYPFVQTGVRFTLVPAAGPRHELRVFVELARAWRQRLWAPAFGLSEALGLRRTRFLLELDAVRYSVPLDRLREDFLDGQLIGSTVTQEPVRTLTLRARAGLTVRP